MLNTKEQRNLLLTNPLSLNEKLNSKEREIEKLRGENEKLRKQYNNILARS